MWKRLWNRFYRCFATVPDAMHCLAGIFLALIVTAGILALVWLPAGLALGLAIFALALWLLVVSALPKPRVQPEYTRQADVF